MPQPQWVFRYNRVPVSQHIVRSIADKIQHFHLNVIRFLFGFEELWKSAVFNFIWWVESDISVLVHYTVPNGNLDGEESTFWKSCFYKQVVVDICLFTNDSSFLWRKFAVKMISATTLFTIQSLQSVISMAV